MEPRNPVTEQDGTQTWLYRAYRKWGCLFGLAVVFGTMLLFSFLTLCVFRLHEVAAVAVTLVAMFAVSFVCHRFTTEVDLRQQAKSFEAAADASDEDPVDPIADWKPGYCLQCEGFLVVPLGKNQWMCQDCGYIWEQDLD